MKSTLWVVTIKVFLTLLLDESQSITTAALLLRKCVDLIPEFWLLLLYCALPVLLAKDINWILFFVEYFKESPNMFSFSTQEQVSRQFSSTFSLWIVIFRLPESSRSVHFQYPASLKNMFTSWFSIRVSLCHLMQLYAASTWSPERDGSTPSPKQNPKNLTGNQGGLLLAS